MNQTELEGRILDISSGVWTSRAEPFLTLIDELSNASFVDAEERLRTLLRAHWIPGNEILDHEESTLRDSFDFALSYFQLIELALETGYLPLNEIRKRLRDEMKNLFQYRATRRFVEQYQYVGVEYLANRMGFAGFGQHSPPEPIGGLEIQYATFLDHHRRWSENPYIEEWLGFLDDYVEDDDEQQQFYQFLVEGRDQPTLRFIRLGTGAHLSLVMLADLFAAMSDEEIPRFGVFYSYWLAKLFGFSLGPHGYNKILGSKLWAEAVTQNATNVRDSGFTGLKKNAEENPKGSDSPTRRLDLLADVWERTRRLVSHANVVVPVEIAALIVEKTEDEVAWPRSPDVMSEE